MFERPSRVFELFLMAATLGETTLRPDLLRTSNSFSSCIILPMISFCLPSPAVPLLLGREEIFEVGVTPSENIRDTSGFFFDVLYAHRMRVSLWLRCPELLLLRRLREHELELGLSIETRSMDSLCLVSNVFDTFCWPERLLERIFLNSWASSVISSFLSTDKKPPSIFLTC